MQRTKPWSFKVVVALMFEMFALGACSTLDESLKAPTGGPTIALASPVIVTTGPPNVMRWGFYQFPDMWRAPGGKLYLSMNVGEDNSIVGEHRPTQFFVSSDQGQSWQPIRHDQVDFSPDIYTLPNGQQVAFGKGKFVYHFSSLSPSAREEYSLEDLGLKPVMTFMDGWEYSVYAYYRYADLPEELRRIPMLRRAGPDAPWRREYATIEPSDLLFSAGIRSLDDSWEWHNVPPKVSNPVFSPQRVVVLPDETLLWVHST
ncbi:hypothetical protein MYX78_00145, partial [Acidobacteria bacterium AH-259-G07]|nr:hypothetical protein [Acidobacteria bacterium AH-259-G07]